MALQGTLINHTRADGSFQVPDAGGGGVSEWADAVGSNRDMRN